MEKDYGNKNEMKNIECVALKGLTDSLSKVINKLDYNEEWILESKYL